MLHAQTRLDFVPVRMCMCVFVYLCVYYHTSVFQNRKIGPRPHFWEFWNGGGVKSHHLVVVRGVVEPKFGSMGRGGGSGGAREGHHAQKRV